jgi:general secretion pathway protein F
MASFAYRAYLPNGREEAGAIEATDLNDATRQLSAKGCAPYLLQSTHKGDVRPSARLGDWFAGGRGQVSQHRLFADLALLTEAGLTLPQALKAARAGESVVAQNLALERISNSMAQGRSAADAFGNIEGVSAETLALLASAERSAQMPRTLRAIAARLGEAELRARELRAAMVYPLFLLLLMCGALTVVVFVLVPSLAPIFDNADRPPPLSIRFFSALGKIAVSPLAQLVGIGISVAVGLALLPSGRRQVAPVVQRALLALPLIGTTLRKGYAARYLSSLSILLGGGAPMTEALTLCAKAHPIAALRNVLLTARDNVASGERLPAALERSQQFHPRIISLIGIGDQANRLPTVLERAADILDTEVKATLDRALAMLAPAMTIILGLVIGGLVVSVMTALLSINDLAVQG